MTSLPIAQIGNPALRNKAKYVGNILNPKIQDLITNMLATVIKEDGVGIAAPQLSQPLQIFIMASRPNARYPDAPKMQATAIINPKIIWKSEEMTKDWEGCLSIPSIRGLVPRHQKIKVEYFTQDNRFVEAKYDDFLARVFQHEYDHLNGTVFIDRVESSLDLIAESEWKLRVLGNNHGKETKSPHRDDDCRA